MEKIFEKVEISNPVSNNAGTQTYYDLVFVKVNDVRLTFTNFPVLFTEAEAMADQLGVPLKEL